MICSFSIDLLTQCYFLLSLFAIFFQALKKVWIITARTFPVTIKGGVEVNGIDEKKLIIHDSKNSNFTECLQNKYPASVILSPEKTIRSCVGCLGCWLKTPGTCVLNDSFSNMGKIISQCTEMIFISRCTYGAFSPFVKNVIDRSISYMLPLFKKKGKHSYHYRRYTNVIRCTAYFYSENLTGEEKDTALRLCHSNAALWDCSTFDVFFLTSISEVLGGRNEDSFD